MPTVKIQTSADSNFIAFGANVIDTLDTATFSATAITLRALNGDRVVIKGDFAYAEGQDPSIFTLVGGSATQINEVSAGNQAYATLSGATISVSDVISSLQTQTFDTVLAGINGYTFKGNAGSDIAFGTFAKDTLFGAGGSDALSGLGGNDIINGEDGNDVLKGGSGNDHLNGGAGRDNLLGQAGQDTLDGGAGHDVLSGSSDADIFVLANIQSSSDRIKDFVSGTDKLSVSATLFGGGLVSDMPLANTQVEVNSTGHASSADVRFVFDSGTGSLYYDATGSVHGATDAVLVATLQGELTGFSSADFLIL